MPVKKILTFVNSYLPGYKSGGAIRTLAGMTEWLGDDLRFLLITQDRDLGDEMPYPNVHVDAWQNVGKARVFYASPRSMSVVELRRLMRSTEYDMLYLNSFFHPEFTFKPLMLRSLGQVPRRPVILAPRGEFSPGAIQLKAARKSLFVQFVKGLGLTREVIWHASTEQERDEIRSWFPDAEQILVARDLVAPSAEHSVRTGARTKVSGSLRAVFISRISRKKNLLGALQILRSVQGEVHLNIYGPIEDSRYWEECQGAIHILPPNVTVAYQGVVEHGSVHTVLQQHHVLFFPTFGENFGHVVLEALVAGCLVLTSDQTPWSALRLHGVGWTISLRETGHYRDALNELTRMHGTEFDALSSRASELGRRMVFDNAAVRQNIHLFDVVHSAPHKGRRG